MRRIKIGNIDNDPIPRSNISDTVAQLSPPFPKGGSGGGGVRSPEMRHLITEYGIIV